MASEQGISKVIYGGQTLIDLTADTVKADKLLRGYTAHGADGEQFEGTCPYDADTSGATASDAEILSGKTAYVKGSKVTGKMPNYGSYQGAIIRRDEKLIIPQGYHDGSGFVELEYEESKLLIPENVRQGVTILGIEGTMSGLEDVNAQPKSVTPKANQQQVVVPDSGYNYLTQVTVAAIPYTVTDNSAGGKTVTIG